MERVEDLVYAELLFLSLVFSMIMRQVSSGAIREVSGAVVGILMVYYFTGVKVMYSFTAVVINIILFTFVKNRYMPLFSFLLTFIYLGILRAIHLFGFPGLVTQANAVQLIMTLRLVGLSFEIEDSRRRSASERFVPTTRPIDEPSWWQVILYAYNFAGIFTGPYYTYSMHRDVIDGDTVMQVPVWKHISWRIWNLTLSLPAFVLLVYAFPLKMMKEEEFYDETIFYRIWIGFLVFIWMRCRVYSAWMVAESICVLNGIGLYPVNLKARVGCGPTKPMEDYDPKSVEYDTEAVRNLDIWAIEFEPSFRGGIRAWNRSVQFWLANFVYKRVPRTFGMILTMSVSAYWHGIHPGYYLSFLTIPLCTLAEDRILNLVPTDENGHKPFLFNLCWYIVRQLGFAFMASGFLLLTWKDTIRYWSSVTFYIHWIMGIIIVFTWLYRSLFYVSKDGKAFGLNQIVRIVKRLIGVPEEEPKGYDDKSAPLVKELEPKKEL
ncbi:hypothetical protein AB6A40_002528 [Gnathostoma spinigerum]|uniref:Lysophospholipid acyltransferase 7 n=1 Tax=Gnathostoma spinigerum TaxID=75299 RepID=A0ABD6ECE6_9BILA